MRCCCSCHATLMGYDGDGRVRRPSLAVPKGVSNYEWHYCLPCVREAWAPDAEDPETAGGRALAEAREELVGLPLEDAKTLYARGLMTLEEYDEHVGEVLS